LSFALSNAKVSYTGGMEVLFATTNPAKIEAYREGLERRGIRVLTLADVDFALNVEETGVGVLENARLKAEAYAEASGLMTVAMDNGLWIEKVDGSEQPGAEVRRVAGKRLDDEAMIRHYSEVIARYGGRLAAKWQFGIAVCANGNVAQYLWERDGFDLVDRPCEARRPGYPLDSLSVLPTGEYVAERWQTGVNKDERADEAREVAEFVYKALLGDRNNKKSKNLV